MTIDNSPDSRQFSYGAIFPRLAAAVIDRVIIYLPFGLFEYFYNIPQYKSVVLLSIFFLIQLSYKPLLEFHFGTTIGKSLFNLRVVNYDSCKPTLMEALLRNIFTITTLTINFIIAYLTYSDSSFLTVTTQSGYNELASHFVNRTHMERVVFIILLIDIAFFIQDPKRRSLHDRIGKTYVVN
jgi:uncharacterized RDD family membrane protein YckC